MKLRKHYSMKMFIIISLVLVVLLAILVGGGGAYYYFFMKDNSNDDFSELEVIDGVKNKQGKDAISVKQKPEKKVAPFSKEDTVKVIAKELDIKYPFTKKFKPVKLIKKEIKKAFHKKTKGRYSNKNRTRLIQKLVFKYMEAKPGDTVEFYIKTPSKSFSSRDVRIKGKFVSNRNGTLTVGEANYSLMDIDPDYQYLFDANIARKLCQKKIKEFKIAFKKKKDIALDKYIPELEQKYYKKARYIQDEDGKWLTAKEYLNKVAEQAHKLYLYVNN